MLPSIIYILLTTLASSFFSVYGLIFNNSAILIVATIMAPTAEAIYNIVKNYLINKKFNLFNLLIYLLICISVPLIIGILFGFFLEILKNKYYKNSSTTTKSQNIKSTFNTSEEELQKTTINIPSQDMLEMLKFSRINMFFNILTPIICCLFLPYALQTNNICLIVAISIGLSFVTPLTVIGLFIGSNKYTKKQYTIKDYTIPFLNFSCNLFSLLFSSYIMIKFGFDKT